MIQPFLGYTKYGVSQWIDECLGTRVIALHSPPLCSKHDRLSSLVLGTKNSHILIEFGMRSRVQVC